MDVVAFQEEVLVPVYFLQFLVTVVKSFMDSHLLLVLDQPSERVVSPDEVKRD